MKNQSSVIYNVFATKFDNRSIYSNIKTNDTKLDLLNSNLQFYSVLASIHTTKDKMGKNIRVQLSRLLR